MKTYYHLYYHSLTTPSNEIFRYKSNRKKTGIKEIKDLNKWRDIPCT